MNRFKIKDKVLIKNHATSKPELIGKIGVITLTKVGSDESLICVKFKGWSNGHFGASKIMSDYSQYFFHMSNVKLVKKRKPKKAIKKTGKKAR